MKTSLIYDTETTGLPKFEKPSDDPSQPRITQLAAELIDDDTGHVLAGMNFLIKPEGWTIPEDVSRITGITTEMCHAYGLPMRQVLPIFLGLWMQTNVHRVAHNESFDMRMVRIELFRNGHTSFDADQWKHGKAFCTCASSAAIVKAPPTEKMLKAGRKGYKNPNMSEAYKHFTGLDLEGAHNAANDLMACKAVYFALKRIEAAA